MNVVQIPIPVFFDSDGRPLDGGYVFLGVSGLNPISNPISVYYDAALTIPATDIRTSGGYVLYNGAPANLYVSGAYSLLVMDKNRKVVFSALTFTQANSGQFMTEPRGSLTRAMRTPPSYNIDDVLESGFYSWTNAGTTNYPTGCAASDEFALEVWASPDGAGFVVQRLLDMTNGPGSVSYLFLRQSSDGGTSWTTWVGDSTSVFPGAMAISLTEWLTTNEPYVAAGSVVEVGGNIYRFAVNSGGTGWGGIAASSLVYLYLVPAGASVSWIYSTTAPTWDTAKQGWYNGADRAFGTIYKDAGSLYTNKGILQPIELSSAVARSVKSVSGAVGVIGVRTDFLYLFTAAATITLPASPVAGQKITFKNRGAFTSVISANAGQTIGTTTSTAFSLYAQEDYVTLQWDGISAWFVVATNGPALVANGNAGPTINVLNTWTAIGAGLAFASLAPGIYNFSLAISAIGGSPCVTILAIGNGLAPISETVAQQIPNVGPTTKVEVVNYALNAAATIQAIYYTLIGTANIIYGAGVHFPKMIARRIG